VLARFKQSIDFEKYLKHVFGETKVASGPSGKGGASNS
jgi:hypothetical protein